MALGQKMGSLKALKQSMAKGGGGAFIKYIPKNNSMNVRFIQEPEEWVNYVEHFDPMLRKSFPCNGEASCPGCMGGERKSSRYLANAVDRDDKDRVIPLQMPKDLANRLVARYERNGTLTDRDFELSRSGEGLDTVYDLDAGVKDGARITQFSPLDLLKVLQDAYDSVFGSGDSDDDIDAELKAESARQAGAVKPRGKSRAAAQAEEDPEPDDGEDEPVEEKPKPAKKAPAKKAAAKKAAAPEPEFTPDVDDDQDNADEPEPEDDPEPDTDEAEDEGYTEEVLRAMPMGALRAVARNEFGVATKGLDQDGLIDAIFNASDEPEGDEPPF